MIGKAGVTGATAAGSVDRLEGVRAGEVIVKVLASERPTRRDHILKTGADRITPTIETDVSRTLSRKYPWCRIAGKVRRDRQPLPRTATRHVDHARPPRVAGATADSGQSRDVGHGTEAIKDIEV